MDMTNLRQAISDILIAQPMIGATDQDIIKWKTKEIMRLVSIPDECTCPVLKVNPHNTSKCYLCGRVIPKKPKQEFCECKEPEEYVERSSATGDKNYTGQCSKCCKPIHPEPKPSISDLSEGGIKEYKRLTKELASEEEIRNIIYKQLDSKVWETETGCVVMPSKQKEGLSNELTHALVGKIGKIEPKPELANDLKEKITKILEHIFATYDHNEIDKGTDDILVLVDKRNQ